MTFVRDDLRPVQRRTAILLVLCVAAFFALLARLWVLQVIQGERWQKLAESNRLRRLPLEAPRGDITDVRGEPIVSNRPAFQLLLFPEEIRDREESIRFLTSLGIADEAAVRERVARAMRTSHLPSVIADNLSWAQMAAVAAHRLEYRELEVHQTTRRSFPLGPAAAHLVGQLGEVGPEQLGRDDNLRPGQLVGRSGLEKTYQHILGGTMGNLVIMVDALGRQVSKLSEEKPLPGKPLRTTIDAAVQRAADEAMTGQVGAVVALDPRSGAVRALLSHPAFDPERFAGFLEPAYWRQLVADPLHPLTNRAVQALYPPGSTIKPLLAAGALGDGARAPGDSVYCTGQVQIYGHPYRCWRAGGHGRVDVEAAIEMSCDSYFYYLARDVGLERLTSWMRTFGLGRPTGIDLPGEAAGLVPSDEWSWRVRRQKWFAGETISVGIGQGPILATPIQLAVAYAALVNGGFLVRPHLVPAAAQPPRPIGLPAAALARVQVGMLQVVHGERGTARRLAAQAPPIMAGKTGTTQVVRKREGVRWQDLPWEQRHHALFVGYAPAERPEIVVAVVVEHGGEGGSVAAPIAGKVLAAALGQGAEGVSPAGMSEEAGEPPSPPPVDMVGGGQE